MFKRIIIAAALAVICVTASAQAGVSFQCKLDGERVNMSRGPATCTCSKDVAVGAKCPFNNAPSGATSAPQQTPMPVVGNQSVGGVRTLSPSELANLAQTISPQDLKQPTTAPQARPAAAPAVSQAPAQPFRVFTPGVNIEVLAGAFKTGSEGAVLNAPTREIVHAIYNLSGVTVTPAMLVNGSLIDCQKAGVEGKTRVGVKVKQNMNGLKDFSFVSVGPELKECLPGQKLYVVNANGKFIAIADDSGFLLGPQTATAGIKIDG